MNMMKRVDSLEKMLVHHGTGRFFDKLCRVVLLIALIAGGCFRLRMYLMNRSLWVDPAMLAVNLIEKDYQELWGKLDWEQSAPIGFLLVSKFIGNLYDYSELSLTILPLLAGICALVMFLVFSVEMLGVKCAILAFLPFSFCSTAIYYSGEFKQYSFDLFFSVLLLWLAFRLIESPSSCRTLLLYSAVSVVSFWFSHASIIVVIGTFAGLMWVSYGKSSKKTFLTYCTCCAIVVLGNALLYFYHVRPASVGSMFNYWRMGFAPVDIFSLATLKWWFKTLSGYSMYPLGFRSIGVVIAPVMLLSGVVSLCMAGATRKYAGILLLPLGILLLLSIAGKYPIVTGEYNINSRLILFTVPIACIIMALGIIRFSSYFKYSRQTCVVITVIIVYFSITRMIPWPYMMQQEMRPLVASLYSDFADGDSVYVYRYSVPAFQYYTRHKPLPYVKGNTIVPSELLKDVARATNGNRVWAVISHDPSNHHEIIKKELSSIYRETSSENYPGAMLILSR